MAKTRKNKNKKNSKNLNVFVAPSRVVFLILIVMFVIGVGLFIQHNNTILANKINNAEIENAELISVLRSEKANLSLKVNIEEIQKSLREHGIAMRQLRNTQKYVTCLDKTKAPNLNQTRTIVYNKN